MRPSTRPSKAREAVVARIGRRVFVYPPGAHVPAGAVIYGPAAPEVIYTAFYAATHCRRGHRRRHGVCEYRSHCYQRHRGDFA